MRLVLSNDHPDLANSPLLRSALLTLQYAQEHGAIGLGATLTSFAFAPFLEPLPTIAAADAARIDITVLVTGGVWWGLSIAGLMWATLRLDPARGILLMPEVIFGAGTAAILAGETLFTSETIGGGLVILCGLLEVRPTKADAGHQPASKTMP
jgi:hypothetical protein